MVDIKRSLLKVAGNVCGLFIVVLIIYMLFQLMLHLEATIETSRNVYRDSRVEENEGVRTVLFYALSMIFAGLSGFFAILSVLMRK